MTRWISCKPALLVALLAVAGMAASCGREAPVYQPGNIAVTSTPPGAAIYLDGQDTGLLTPATLEGLVPDNYVVSVALEGYLVQPTDQTAIVSPLRTTQVPDFALSQTSLVVTSTPEGAAIFLDGEDTGQITPATLVGVPGGSVEVSLVLPGYLVSPSSFTATVIEGEANEIPGDTFALRSARTVLFEGFSNVACLGCPQMATNMEELMHMPEYGLDRVLYVKYSMQWPSAQDPFYVHNTTENNARMNYYLNDLIAGIPVLAMEGVKITGTSANETPLASEIIPQVETNLALDPGFLIDVTGDFTGTSVPVTVSLTALDDVALAGKTLAVVLVQTFVYDEEVTDVEGGHEFHYLFRDRADSVDALTDLAAGQTQVINTTVLRDAWDLETLLVIAFVQDDSDKTILQAGSTGLNLATPASLFVDDLHHQRNITSGGE